MKKISLALSFLSFVAFLYPAAAGSAFKPVNTRRERLNACVASLEASLVSYRDTMKPFADEQRALGRFGMQIVASSDPESAQAKLESKRDRFLANKRLLLCEILRINQKSPERVPDSTEHELQQELIYRPLTPESETAVEIFWKIKEAVETEEKTYKVPSVFPKPDSGWCLVQ